MAKYDVEDLLISILAIMTTSSALNTKIAAIDAEKTANGQELTPALASIPSTAYFPQTWSNKILNEKVAIFYGVEDVQATDGAGGTVAKTYKVFVEVVMVDNGQTNDIYKRIARYSRALEELFADVYAPAIGSHVKVESVRPISFKVELDSDEEIKVGGVSLTITLV